MFEKGLRRAGGYTAKMLKTNYEDKEINMKKTICND